MSITIETKRLRLESITHLNDALLEELAALNLDESVREFFPGGVQTMEQTKARCEELIEAFSKHGTPIFIIYSLESGKFLGRCGFTPYEDVVEVGYLLVKSHWRQGLATEALSALLQWSDGNIDNEIIGFAPITHVASQRVMEKCGMQPYKEDYGHGVKCRFYKHRQ